MRDKIIKRLRDGVVVRDQDGGNGSENWAQRFMFFSISLFICELDLGGKDIRKAKIVF